MIQHEIDHLDGVLIVDRTTQQRRAAALRALREREAPADGRGRRRALTPHAPRLRRYRPFAELVLDRARSRSADVSPPLARHQPRPAARAPRHPAAVALKRWPRGAGCPCCSRAPRTRRPSMPCSPAAPDVFVVCAYGQIVAADGPRRRRDPRRAPVARAALARRGAGGARAHGRRDRARRGDAAHDGGRRRGPGRRRRAGARAARGRRRPGLRAAGAGRPSRGSSATLDGIAAARVEWRRAGGRADLRRQDRGADRQIDWSRPARQIADQVRALSPHVGAVTELWRQAHAASGARAAGEGPLPADGPRPARRAAGEGWLEVLELQQEGRRRMTRRGVPARRRPAPGARSEPRREPRASARPAPRPARRCCACARARPSRRLARRRCPSSTRSSERDRALANELVSGTVKRRGSARRRARRVHRRRRSSRRRRRARRPAPRRLPAALPRPRAGATRWSTTPSRWRRREPAAPAGFVNAVLRRWRPRGASGFAALAERRRRARLGAAHLVPARGWSRCCGASSATQPRRRCSRPPTRPPSAACASTAARRLAGGRRRRWRPTASRRAASPGLPDGAALRGPALERSAPFRDGLVTPQSRGSQLAGMVAPAGRAGGRARRVAGPLRRARAPRPAQLAAAVPGGARRRRRGRRGARRRPARQPRAPRRGRGATSCVADVLDAAGRVRRRLRRRAARRAVQRPRHAGSRADLRWRRRPARRRRASRQLQAGCWRAPPRCVEPGGALTYAVCTLTRAETLGVVDAAPRAAAAGRPTTSAPPGRACAHPAAGGFLLVLPPERRLERLLRRPPATRR